MSAAIQPNTTSAAGSSPAAGQGAAALLPLTSRSAPDPSHRTGRSPD